MARPAGMSDDDEYSDDDFMYDEIPLKPKVRLVLNVIKFSSSTVVQSFSVHTKASDWEE